MKERVSHIISISIILFFLFIAFGSIDDDSSTTAQKSSRQNNKLIDETYTQAEKDSLLRIQKELQIKERENQTIAAYDLYSIYQANEVNADNNFKGKYFYVEGIVSDIKKDILDDIYVTLKTGEIIGSVQCFLEDEEVAAQLKKGQQITVYGKCDGLFMNVLMKNCEVVDNLSELKKD